MKVNSIQGFVLAVSIFVLGTYVGYAASRNSWKPTTNSSLIPTPGAEVTLSPDDPFAASTDYPPPATFDIPSPKSGPVFVPRDAGISRVEPVSPDILIMSSKSGAAFVPSDVPAQAKAPVQAVQQTQSEKAPYLHPTNRIQVK